MTVVQRKTFGQYLREIAAWLRVQPVTRPILALLYSRKVAIASALTGLIVSEFPKLVTVENEVYVVIAELVLISIIWLVTSLGFALEDVAAKKAAAPFLG